MTTTTIPREVPERFTIPDTTDGIVDCLRAESADTAALLALLTAKEWAKAALITALVGSPEDAQQRRRAGKKGSCVRDHSSDCWDNRTGCSRSGDTSQGSAAPYGVVELARKKVVGLSDAHMIRVYRDRWCAHRPAPTSGDVINLAGLPDWEPLRPGQYAARVQRATAEVTSDPQVVRGILADAPAEEVAEAVREAMQRPEVAVAVMEDRATARATRHAESQTERVRDFSRSITRGEKEREAQRDAETVPLLTSRQAMLVCWEVQGLMDRAEKAKRDDEWHFVMGHWVDFLTRQVAYATALRDGLDQPPIDMDAALRDLLDREREEGAS